MNYEKLYTRLIESAKRSPKIDSYKEMHHIIPKCLGGENTKDNLVCLTTRQHYLAHWLLYKIYRTSKLVHAWHSMSRIGKGQSTRSINSHLFEYAKVARKRVMSLESKGESNSFYGKHHTEETKLKLKNIRLGKLATPETKEKMSKTRTGVLKTEEHKAKIGRPGMRMLKNSITGECVRVKHEDALKYDSTVWKTPYTLREKIYGNCPNCGKYGELSATFKRWHFNNCRGIK